MPIFSSSSSSSSEYFTDNSERTEVKQWRNDLVAGAASNRTIAWIKHKKCETGVNHEYLLFGVNDALFVTERNKEDPPDYKVTHARVANTLLTTLTPNDDHTLPERTFARILAVVSARVPDYYWYANNCFWYSGSVCETIRVGLGHVGEAKTPEYKKRGKVKKGWFSKSVGTAPGRIGKSLYLTRN